MTRSAHEIFRGLYALTDSRLSGVSDLQTVAILVKAGVRVIQFRNKTLDPRTCYLESVKMAELCRSRGGVFIVNDRPDVALEAGADGVHLGQDDLHIRYARRAVGDRLWIGVSTHSPDQAEEAEQSGADYIGFGPMFATTTKDAGIPRGLAMLEEARRRVRLPVVAIGGIQPENVPSVIAAGANMVAVASGLLAGGSIHDRVRLFEAALDRSIRDDC